jgi:surface carbohydrate biosynthesis protein
LRKVRRIPGSQSDILIIDESNLEYLMNCIPEKYSVAVMYFRGVIPLIINLSFFFKLLQRMIQFKIKYIALISAIVDEINPKIIITFTDNARVMGVLSELFQDKMVISVQNGVRSNSHLDIGIWDKNVKVPHYYGFGDFEKDMFKSKKVKIEKYIPTGSIKMAAFVSKYNNWISNCNKKKQVCLVSQFRVSMLKNKDQLQNDFHKILKQIYLYLVIWSDKRNVKLVIALFYNHDVQAHKDELNFYQEGLENYTHIEYAANKHTEMFSYKLGIESEVVVGIDSTLSYELFGYGCKLLNCVGADKDFLHRWGSVGNISKMPKLVLLEQLKSNHFEEKMDKLFCTEHQKYMAITKEARSYYMKFNDDPAYEIIKRDIVYFLENNKKPH